MVTTVQEAMAIDIATVAAISCTASAVVRLCRIDKIWTGLFVPGSFLCSYFVVYNKIPVFPPIGAVSKVFYVIVLGAIIGLIVDCPSSEILRQEAA